MYSPQPKGQHFEIALSLNTLGHLDYESQLMIAAQAGWKAVGVSMLKVEEFLAGGKTLEDAREFSESQDIRLVEMMGFRDWISKRGKARDEMLAAFVIFSKACKKMGNPLVLTPTLAQVEVETSLATENFRGICRIAAEDGNRVGLEFIPYSPIDSLKKAYRIVEGADSPNGGIILDFFHFFNGQSSLADLEEVPLEKIFHVHVSDLKKNAEEDLTLLSRNYRVLPGEGDYTYRDVLENLFKRGYSQYFSLEVLNRGYAIEDPLNVAQRAKESLERLLNDHAGKR